MEMWVVRETINKDNKQSKSEKKENLSENGSHKSNWNDWGRMIISLKGKVNLKAKFLLTLLLQKYSFSTFVHLFHKLQLCVIFYFCVLCVSEGDREGVRSYLRIFLVFISPWLHSILIHLYLHGCVSLQFSVYLYICQSVCLYLCMLFCFYFFFVS